MEYDVKLASLSSIPLSPDGREEPLCNSCMSLDCTNPIAKTQVSLFGKEETYRLYKYGSSYKMVVDCDGYMKKPEANMEEPEDED